jgi:hypothetical protein
MGVLACLCALVWSAAYVPAARAADRIDDEFPAQAGKILKYLKDKGYKNVGVLKFRVKKGSEPSTFHAGPLNVAMANRLENVLLIKNDRERPIGIIHEAFRVAASRKERASYLSPAGCAKLFKYRYPLVWGDQQVEADAFVTGLVQLSPDLRTTTIRIEALERDSPTLRQVVSFDVRTDRTILTDVCQSFALNSNKLRTMGGDEPEEQAVKDAGDRASRKTRPGNPWRLVDLEVLYDGKPVPILQNDDSEFVEQEPGEGQTVVFRLRNKSDTTVGVVLAVNGKNTLYEEDLNEKTPAQCARWILEPGTTYTIQGFYQRGDRSYLPFKVLSEEESAVEEEQNPHPRLGVIQVVVFQEGSDTATALLRGQGLRKPVAVRKLRPKTAGEAADAARQTASVRQKAMGFIKAGGEAKEANLEEGVLRNPTQQEDHVIRYRASKK